ncbi:MAG TPA: hypothetical protein VGP93_03265, partial [Polyangiaceae bacterium]|nr:hypothetical protein [Polyangiaceae bacterium]
FELHENERQDLQASTATLVRSLQWATGVLGIEAPALFLRGELGSEIVVVPQSEPALLADRSLGSGLDPKELAFLWGRALGAFRPENVLAIYYPSEQELALLLQAAKLASRGKAASAAAGELKTLASLLEQSLEPARRKELGAALKAVSNPEEAAEDWLVSYELCCARAGLLLCADLSEAARLSERFAFGNVTEPAAQIDELLLFGISEEYATLRTRLGVAVTG